MFGVIDNSTHEHEIAAAGGHGNGMCQTKRERKDEEEEEGGEYVGHGCDCGVSRLWVDRRRERKNERMQKEDSSRVLRGAGLQTQYLMGCGSEKERSKACYHPLLVSTGRIPPVKSNGVSADLASRHTHTQARCFDLSPAASIVVTRSRYQAKRNLRTARRSKARGSAIVRTLQGHDLLPELAQASIYMC